MLTHLHIRKLALCDELDLDLKSGLTVLTGETGAGKSILIGAVAMALGRRGDASLVRKGAERAEITLEFDIAHLPNVQQWLQNHELDSQEDCQLRRVINREGRSKGYINGSPVPLQRLAELGNQLMDIHGQHEHHALLRGDYQRLLLDRFGGLQGSLNGLMQAWQHWRELEKKMAAFETESASLTAEQVELLRHQITELESLSAKPGEFDRLAKEQCHQAHADALRATYQHGLEALDQGEHTLTGQLHQTIRSLHEQSGHDTRVNPVIEMLESAAIQISEAAADLKQLLSGIEADPKRLQALEQRMGAIQDIARKHRIECDALPERLTQLRHQIERNTGFMGQLEALQADKARAEADFRSRAEALHEKRMAVAKHLSAEVTNHMQQLGMPHGHLVIQVQTLAAGRCTPSGTDRVCFLISTNPSLDPAPLEKAASGGELSRISLAVQVVTARQGTIPTIIFDEVDVGIGGRVAEIVGQHLRSLSKDRQVCCITHLPQVAALGQHHLQVSKTQDKDMTTTQLSVLNRDARHDEIARMLGGIEITRQTHELAADMLRRSMTRIATPQKPDN